MAGERALPLHTMERQLQIFDEAVAPQRPRRTGGSQNPIVFHDYESFIKKFTEKPKTTDECWTPPDVYEAVVRFVGGLIDLGGRDILRPFYPGGDYERAEYPEGGVVIDNPPFSMFTRVCRFYSERGIPFFLFGPGMTIFSCLKYCSAVIVGEQITFSNGAKVRCNFATNLLGDTLVLASPRLSRMIGECPSQDVKVNLPHYRYPEEVVGVSTMQTIARGEEEFSIAKEGVAIIRTLDLHPKKGGGLFGDHLLVAKATARATARAAEVAKDAIPIELSPRERGIVAGLARERG